MLGVLCMEDFVCTASYCFSFVLRMMVSISTCCAQINGGIMAI